jgi:hypothetical protein
MTLEYNQGRAGTGDSSLDGKLTTVSKILRYCLFNHHDLQIYSNLIIIQCREVGLGGGEGENVNLSSVKDIFNPRKFHIDTLF